MKLGEDGDAEEEQEDCEKGGDAITGWGDVQ